MTREIKEFVGIAVSRYGLGGKTLDIGSYDVNGNVREFFTDYTGLDQAEGPNVDIVSDAHDLLDVVEPLEYDTVLCLETLEHDPDFMLTMENVRMALKPGGYAIVTTPANGFPVHRYPKDYWRFNEDAYREILFARHWDILELETIPSGGFSAVVCLARKR